MSGQWEVVGKKKDKVNKLNLQKQPNNAKKTKVLNGPSVEDVLPKSQLKNLYGNSGKSNKENHKPVDKVKPQENGTKKTQKKEKHSETNKVSKPKSIESALNSIDAEEFKQLYSKTKLLFPEGPLVWLKELCQFLNQKTPVEVQDPVFSNRKAGYPYSNIPSSITSTIEKSVEEAGPSNAQLFFDISLTSMATDMSKGLSALGHKIYLQYLAMKDPKIASTNLQKHSVLRNSYQNRQNIGLSVLWALGQAGLKDFNIGLKVFQEIMLPVIEMKNYSRFVVKYLIDLVNRHDNVCITKDQYLLILDVVFSNIKNLPSDLIKDLTSIVPKARKLLFSQSTNDRYHLYVDSLLKKLQNNSNKKYTDELCGSLVVCLSKDNTSFGNWTKSYTKYLDGSAVLLKYIGANWNVVQNDLNKKQFKEMLNTFSATNDELKEKKRKEDGLVDAINAIQVLTNKMSKKKSSKFPLKTLSFLLIVTVGSLVYYDIRQHGSWEQSRTLRTAKEIGIHEYTVKGIDKTKEGFLWANDNIEKNFPEYYKLVRDYLEPFGELFHDVGLVAGHLFADIKKNALEKYPIFIESVESYAPKFLEQSQQAAEAVWSTSVTYFTKSVNYFKEEVFVGQLSPENVQRVVIEALNTTQQKATEYYHWLYEKVQTTIK